MHIIKAVAVVSLQFFFSFTEKEAVGQYVEQEIANYGNLPDSTLRAESCVRAGDYWHCSLYTSYYVFNPQVHAQLVKLNDELQVVESIDQPNRQWNNLFEGDGPTLHAFGVEHLTPLKSFIIGAGINGELDNVEAIHLSDSLEAAILYDVVKHADGYTLLYGHVIPVNQYPFHMLGLMEVNNDLEVVRQQEFEQFPELYNWTPHPNRYRLSMTSAGDYAIVGNNVTWLAEEDWAVIGESDTEFLSDDIGNHFYLGNFLGGALAADSGQQVLVSLSAYADDPEPWELVALNDVYVYSVDMGAPEDELFSFGRVDTNDAAPLKGFIAVEDGYIVAAQSWKYWYNFENADAIWPTSTLLTKLNTEMEPEWELALIDEQQTTVHGVAQDEDAGILLYGQRRYLGSDEYYAHLVLIPNNPVGIDENAALSMSVFPNPTTSHIRLQLPAEFVFRATVTVYSATGQVVARNENFNSLDPLPMNHPPGLYVVEASNGSKVARGKVLVE